MSKEQPNENDCPAGPDGNHVYTRQGVNGDFRCTYCNKVERFDIFHREWK